MSYVIIASAKSRLSALKAEPVIFKTHMGCATQHVHVKPALFNSPPQRLYETLKTRTGVQMHKSTVNVAFVTLIKS